ncbi:uncharacterized protein LOC106052811 isoform X4 [Biomphalaria glabrata]|uniref:Uncharacterized protein LOC106052811 isoform X4 n=1 Tax=Biomphalaria glabrata TaxID=6526 RepID=A0A9W2ZF82_BIOGL|nr:uncharacterized protein LOC106052811 isoform X4 [Biomphalaria glabrata]
MINMVLRMRSIPLRMNSCFLLTVYSWIALSTCHVVDRFSVGQNESFTVRCTIQKFRTEDYPESPYVVTLAAERRPTGEENFQLMAKYSPFAPLEEYRKVTNLPSKRNWNFQFLNGDSFDNRDKIRIVIVVNDGNYKDAGLYRCYYIDPLNRKIYSDNFFLRAYAQGRIVNTGSFGPGDSFIVQCDRNKFQRPGLPKSPRINELIVERKIEGADAYTTMARFRPFLDKIVDRRVTNIPDGRHWEIHFVIGDTADMYDFSITIYVPDFREADAGRYRCSYVDEYKDQKYSDPFTLTLKPKNDTKILNKESIDPTNDTFTVTCDIKRFSPDDYPATKILYSMSVDRKPVGEDAFTSMAKFEPLTKKKTTNTPTGRHWDIQFFDGDASNNRDLLKVVVVVKDASVKDVGLYRCVYMDQYERHFSDRVYLPTNDIVENQIVNKNSVAQNDTLIIVCDVKKFKAQDYPNFPYINWLTIEWMPAGTNDFVTMSTFSPFAYTDVYRTSSNIPGGRRWIVDFIGADTDNNRDTIKIVLVMMDASYRDSGSYRCHFKDYMFKYYSEAQLILPEPNPPSINISLVKPNDVFVVRCDVTKSNQTDLSKGNPLAGLTLQRRLEWDSKYYTLAMYDPFKVGQNRTRVFTPVGREWKVWMTGADSGLTLSLSLTFPDGGCTDAGDYRCMFDIGPDNDRVNAYSKPFRLKSEGGFYLYQITTDPGIHIGLTSDQEEGTELTLGCSYQGSSTLRAVWTTLGPGKLGTITETEPIGWYDAHNCLKTFYDSLMTYTVSRENDGTTFICSVYNGTQLLQAANLTVTIKKKDIERQWCT